MNRRGFTLVELLTVLLIIGILVAVLMPVLAGAITTTKNARLAAEEQNLATALAGFKAIYGDYPPSRIVLWNLKKGDKAPYGSNLAPVQPGDISFGDLNVRTVQAMRKYFPRAGQYFPTTGVCSFDLSWGPQNPTILQGDECLVFFLGGITQKLDNGDLITTGFANDPGNPFTPADLLSNSGRKKGFFEFQSNRLVDLNGNGFASYIDSMSSGESFSNQRAFVYFSAYGNNGYDPNDCNFAEQDDSGATVSRSFMVNFVAADKSRVVSSAAPNPYCIGDPYPKKPVMFATWVNSQSFQILSAGRDGLYGMGGNYDQKATTHLLTGFPNDPAFNRNSEQDNITNFSAGRLD